MWILLNIKQITIWYFWQDITVFHRVFKTCEYFWTFKILQYDIFDRILQYSRVFKMRLNIQKFTIWYCRLDITVFQSIQNMWILLNITNLQYIFLTGYNSIPEYSKCIWILLNIQNVQYDIFNRILQYCRVFKMHLNIIF